jgi:UPF0716 protein FxsA
MWLFLFLVAVPIIEIALFIKVGGFIGLWPTLAIVIGTAFLGSVLLRAQGFAAMTRLQNSVTEGGDPRGPMADGVMILIAGLLMLTPGFFTDALGFLMLLPPVRAAFLAWVGPKLAARVVTMGPGPAGHRRKPEGPSGSTGDTIDADFVDLTEGSPREGGSGWSRPPGDDK